MDTRASYSRLQLAGLFAGPLVAAAVFLSPPPAGLSPEGWGISAIALWMALWWMTEAVPLAGTALLPVVAFPLLGLYGIEETARSYAHPLIFLFLGGFILARGMYVWGLDRRLAHSVIRVAGTAPTRIIGAIMLVTAFLSMWVSNTATTMVMLPIGLSIISAFCGSGEENPSAFSLALLLGIAYAATIGGMGTLIGTPPNALFAAFMETTYGMEISFLHWMMVGVPLLLVMLPLTWVILTKLVFCVTDDGAGNDLRPLQPGLFSTAPITAPERTVTALLVLVALGWMLRPLINDLWPGLQLTDAGIAMTGALLLFAIPVDIRKGHFLLSWKQASDVRWDVLIIFGGGLALASAMGESDLADWIGIHLTSLDTLPLILLLLVIGLIIVVVGELASNTAMAAVFLPIAGATAVSMGEPAILLTLPVALFATLGFMLPVATPPNAIVFGSGAMEIRHMIRAGAVLDIVGILAVTLILMTLGRWLFGIS